MKQKKIFNLKLYLEGMRQLRVVGFLALIINLLFAILIPYGTYLSRKADLDSNNAYIEGDYSYFYSCGDLVGMHAYLFLLPFVFAPIMVIMLFHFLTKREDSDFYHSIPDRRISLFCSFSGSILTWNGAILIIASAASAITYHCCRSLINIDLPQMFFLVINIFVVILLITGALLLSHALCGNMMTIIIIFFILLFAPRIFVELYYLIITDSLPFLRTDILGIFQPDNHLIFCLLKSILTYSDIPAYVSLSTPTLYTLVVALLFYVSAAVCFVKRKSETAGTAMINRMIQTTFRTLFVMIICLIPITLLYSYYFFKQVSDDYFLWEDNLSMFIFYVAISYIAALVAMFIYELVTTKNAKAALKSFKSIPIIIVLNILSLGLLIGSEKYYWNLRLDTDEVSAISICSVDNNDNYYFTHALSDYRFKDKELIRIFCDAFNNYRDKDTSDKNNVAANKEFWENQAEQEYYYTIKFYGNNDRLFYFPISSEEQSEITTLLSKKQQIKNLYLKLPKLQNSDDIYLNDDSIDSSDVFERTIYNKLREELSSGTVDADAWMSSVSSSNADWTLSVYKRSDNDSYSLQLPITTLTPKTYEYVLSKYAEYYENEADGAVRTINDMLDDLESTSPYTYISMNGWSRTNEAFYMEFDFLGENDLEQCIASLEKIRDGCKSLKNYDSDNDILITLDIFSQQRKTSSSNSYTLCMDKAIFRQLCSMLITN